MRAGQLIYSITLARPVYEREAATGEKVVSRHDILATPRAQLIQVDESEKEQGKQVKNVLSYKVAIRAYPDLLPTDAVIYDGETYQIVNTPVNTITSTSFIMKRYI
jgi:hypothetical protein